MTVPAREPDNVVEDIAHRLADQDVGRFLVDIFPGARPAKPDRVVVVQTYPGDPPRLFDADNIPHDERLAVQITARAGGEDEAIRLAKRAYYAVPFRHAVLASGRRYAWCRAEGYPAFIGRDENDRPLVAFNVTLRRHYP